MLTLLTAIIHGLDFCSRQTEVHDITSGGTEIFLDDARSQGHNCSCKFYLINVPDVVDLDDVEDESEMEVEVEDGNNQNSTTTTTRFVSIPRNGKEIDILLGKHIE